MLRTLVAWYGRKPLPLITFIKELQTLCSETLGSLFKPYSVPQIHATLIGLETIPWGKDNNENFKEISLNWLDKNLGSSKITYANLSWIGGILHQHTPLKIQLGGSYSVSFHSSFGKPWQRAIFDIVDNNVVVMGWPVSNMGTPDDKKPLHTVREAFKLAGFVHKYEENKDNDLYMVLGTVADNIDNGSIARATLEARTHMTSLKTPLILEITPDWCTIVEYKDLDLDLKNSRVLQTW